MVTSCPWWPSPIMWVPNDGERQGWGVTLCPWWPSPFVWVPKGGGCQGVLGIRGHILPLVAIILCA